MIAIKTTPSPTLNGSGQFTVTFGQYEEVADASVVFDEKFQNDYVFAASRTISGNVVTVTIKKNHLTDNTWGVAVSADFTGRTVTVVAQCTGQ